MTFNRHLKRPERESSHQGSDHSFNYGSIKSYANGFLLSFILMLSKLIS